MTTTPLDIEHAGAPADAGARAGSQRSDGSSTWNHGGASPLVAPGLCSPLAMMMLGFDDDEEDEFWASRAPRQGPFGEDEESKHEASAASSALMLPAAAYCEPVEELLFDRSPQASSCGDSFPRMIGDGKNRKRVRFALDPHEEIPLPARTTTDDLLLAAQATSGASTNPMLSNPCLSPTITPAPKLETESREIPAPHSSDAESILAASDPLPSRKRRRLWRASSPHHKSTKERNSYVMGKDEQPTFVRRNRVALVLMALGLVLILAVAVPLATLSSSTSPPPALLASNNTTNSSSNNETNAVNGSWTDNNAANSNHGNASSGAAPTRVRRCFSTNGELRDAVDTWLWASRQRQSTNTTPQALYDLAGNYGWPMNNWCVGNVTNMSHLFSAVRNVYAANFDLNISRWDVSNVRDFSYVFLGARLFNHDVSRWRVVKATTMDGMFWNASSYQHSLCEWGPRLVSAGRDGDSVGVSVRRMFRGTSCATRDDPDLDATPVSPLCTPCVSRDDDDSQQR